MPSTDKCNTCSLLTLQQKTVRLKIHQKRAEQFEQQLATNVKQDYCITLVFKGERKKFLKNC